MIFNEYSNSIAVILFKYPGSDAGGSLITNISLDNNGMMTNQYSTLFTGIDIVLLILLLQLKWCIRQSLKLSAMCHSVMELELQDISKYQYPDII